jgi:hypothetical protein
MKQLVLYAGVTNLVWVEGYQRKCGKSEKVKTVFLFIKIIFPALKRWNNANLDSADI